MRTQRVVGRALEDDPVRGKEDGTLGGQERWPAHHTRGLVSAVRQEVHAHAVHHQLLTR